jgi:hypothetical protein
MTAQASCLRHIGKVGVLVVALALVSLVAAVAAVRPAHANSGPSITAYGGPGEIWVSGYGFTPGSTVRVVALTNPGLKAVSGNVYTQADGYGDIGVDLSGLKYVGSAYVAADQTPPIGTAWATTTVQPPPQWISIGPNQQSCGYPVSAYAHGFLTSYNVRFVLLSDDRTKLLDQKVTMADYAEDAYASLGTMGYTGWAWIFADEYGGSPPAPATLGFHLYVC